ncbi:MULTISPECIES: MBL fold metallo-hydrolase [Halorussus]|uniref:MBL fold metallo-hydrolase n=1 Tax=Halorussus TaxID=1070314 RepID=UPI00209FD29D|nr:MBL fold metallo-hydrolase [Halorussus vallis]USZ78366.1 MBL fold metallo-hydrolase [Halorussus vallis]
MVTSNWNSWFVESEVEAADPEGLSLWYLGCHGFVVRSPGATLYVDPYFGDGNPPVTVRMIPVPVDPAAVTDCDAVLVTHEHVDHLHPPSVAPIAANTGAPVFTPGDAHEEYDYDGDETIPADARASVEEGDELSIGDLTVHVRPANDPDTKFAVSYVVECGDETLFVAGDSRPAEAFEEIGAEFDVDVASFTVGTVGRLPLGADGGPRRTRWYMDESQVVEAANAVRADRVLPVHYDTWKGVTADPTALHEHAKSFAYPRVIEVVEVGDRVDIAEPGVVPMRRLDRTE